MVRLILALVLDWMTGFMVPEERLPVLCSNLMSKVPLLTTS